MRLGMLVDPKGKVPVKVIARTFASGKTEKMVYQCLADLNLPSGKVQWTQHLKKNNYIIYAIYLIMILLIFQNDTIEPSDFTFDKFYELYHKICPRNDIEELFQSM